MLILSPLARSRSPLASAQGSLFTAPPPTVALPPGLGPKLLPLLTRLLREAAAPRRPAARGGRPA